MEWLKKVISTWENECVPSQVLPECSNLLLAPSTQPAVYHSPVVSSTKSSPFPTSKFSHWYAPPRNGRVHRNIGSPVASATLALNNRAALESQKIASSVTRMFASFLKGSRVGLLFEDYFVKRPHLFVGSDILKLESAQDEISQADNGLSSLWNFNSFFDCRRSRCLWIFWNVPQNISLNYLQTTFKSWKRREKPEVNLFQQIQMRNFEKGRERRPRSANSEVMSGCSDRSQAEWGRRESRNPWASVFSENPSSIISKSPFQKLETW